LQKIAYVVQGTVVAARDYGAERIDVIAIPITIVVKVASVEQLSQSFSSGVRFSTRKTGA